LGYKKGHTLSQLLPLALTEAIEEIGRLPGVGERTAERYAYFLLRADKNISDKLSKAINRLHSGVKSCPITFALIDADEEVSNLYSDSNRDKTTIAVVEEPLDIIALERTGQFHGTYHVLGGAISPIEGIGPEQLHIPELVDRIKKDNVQEIIIATNASVEGESTAIFLQRYLIDNGIDIKITRLARGIPVGVDLEYASQITLTHALDGRRAF
jgi:recombination protein RecR